MSELDDFEEFAAEALRQGFTVHLTHFRFHAEHAARYPFCVSRIELDVIPITEEAKARCLGKRGHCESRKYKGERTGDVLPLAWEFLRTEKSLPDHKEDPIRHGTHCTIEGCESPIITKGMCSRHYQRDYRRRRLEHAA